MHVSCYLKITNCGISVVTGPKGVGASQALGKKNDLRQKEENCMKTSSGFEIKIYFICK